MQAYSSIEVLVLSRRSTHSVSPVAATERKINLVPSRFFSPCLSLSLAYQSPEVHLPEVRGKTEHEILSLFRRLCVGRASLRYRERSRREVSTKKNTES